MTVRRFDSVTIDFGAITRTPSGGLRIPAAVTRTGIFEYKTNDGKVVREYRPAAEVFHPDSLASLQGAVITELHPPVKVDPSNWQSYSKGHVVEGSVKPENDHLLSSLAIENMRTIEKIDAKELVEISCGYDCDFDTSPGTTPDGLPYDRAQKNIRYNHVAMGPANWGRAGSSVSLRLDSAGNMIPGCAEQPANRGKRPMTIRGKVKIVRHGFRIDGVSFDLRTDAGRKQARAAVDALSRNRTDDVATYRTDDKSEAAKAVMETLSTLSSQLTSLLGDMVDTAEQTADDDTAEKKPEDKKTDEDKPEDKKTDEEEKKTDTDEDKSAEKKTDEDKPEAKMDSAVEYLADVRAKAIALVPSIAVKGKSAKALIRETVKAYGTANKKDYASRVDSFSDGKLAGLFEGLEPAPVRSTFGAALGGKGRNEPTREDSAEVSPKAAYEAHLNKAHKGIK